MSVNLQIVDETWAQVQNKLNEITAVIAEGSDHPVVMKDYMTFYTKIYNWFAFIVVSPFFKFCFF